MKKSGNKVRFYVNQYDVEMLEIKSGKKRPVFISLKKALAILGTTENVDAVEMVEKHGRELFRIMYPDGKKFNVGQTKVDTVLDSETQILLAMHSSIDSTKEA